MSLSIDGLGKRFGEKVLFENLTFDFPKTGIYAPIGGSGSGKTTLLRIICGLDKVFTGTVSGGGAQKTSVCFQEHRLFPGLNAIDNIAKISFSEDTPENRKAAEEMLSRLLFTEADMKLFPHELSGGMRQRVAFARAVLRSSDILILDEATKELDSASVSIMLDIIREESQKRLVLIVSHKQDELDALGAICFEINPIK